jgi:hypothetical protein
MHVLPDSASITAIAALVSSLASLVWALRRAPGRGGGR